MKDETIWNFLEVFKNLLFIACFLLGILCFIIGYIAWYVTGNDNNIFLQFLGYIIGTGLQIWMFLWFLTGIHDLKEQNAQKR